MASGERAATWAPAGTLHVEVIAGTPKRDLPRLYEPPPWLESGTRVRVNISFDAFVPDDAAVPDWESLQALIMEVLANGR